MEAELTKAIKATLGWFDPKCPKCRMGLSWGGILKNGMLRCADCKIICIIVAKEIEFSEDKKSYSIKDN